MKDFLVQLGIIENGEAWMDMLKSRNKHHEETAKEVNKAVLTVYYKLFQRLNEKLECLASDE